LTVWHVLTGPGDPGSLQSLVSVPIKWHELPAVVHVVAKIDMIRRFERETPEMFTHIIFRITIVVRAKIAWRADDHVNHFTTKLETGSRHPVPHLGIEHRHAIMA